MKATFRNLGLAIVAILMAVSFSACSDDDDKTSGGGLVGTWKYTENYGGGEYDSLTITFKSDGTFKYQLDGYEEGERYSYYYTGDYVVKGGGYIRFHVTYSSDYGRYDDYFDQEFELDGNRLYFFDDDEDYDDYIVLKRQ